MLNANVIKSVVPAITSSIFRAKEAQSPMLPQTCALAALAMFHMMTSFTREDVVPVVSLVELSRCSIEKANRTNNDMKSFHYSDSPVHLIGLAKHLGFLSMNEDKSFQMTERWIELVSTKDTCVPLTTKASPETRRKPLVKGGKVRPSKLFAECIDFLESTEYHVEHRMVEVVDAVLSMFANNNKDMPASIKSELHVWNNSKLASREDVLFSDYFGDNRGRLYHVACAGPNPQSSDFARSLYSHNIENIVSKLDESGSLSPAYNMFMSELADISGGKWVESKMLTRVAMNPTGALFHMLTTGDAPKKPFTYIRLALDWYKFETTGECDSRVGFGLDAKCSGTQYLAFISGATHMAKATGLVGTDDKSADPYQLSLVELTKLLNKSSMRPTQEQMDTYLNKKDGRAYIKTPYMAIQYGGGAHALLGSKDFCEASLKFIEPNKLEQYADLVVEAIHIALGDKINLFIERTQEAVRKLCEERGVAYIDYRHTDNFLVHKPCYPQRIICDAFSIRVDSQTRVIFGQMVEGKAWEVRETFPTVDEFVRTFVVNYIQGIDALVARTVAKYAKLEGLRGFTSIHDCFRCCLADAPKMMGVIRKAYVEIFVKNNQFESLSKQLGGINMFHNNIVTEELLNSEHAYYFCQ